MKNQEIKKYPLHFFAPPNVDRVQLPWTLYHLDTINSMMNELPSHKQNFVSD